MLISTCTSSTQERREQPHLEPSMTSGSPTSEGEWSVRKAKDIRTTSAACAGLETVCPSPRSTCWHRYLRHFGEGVVHNRKKLLTYKHNPNHPNSMIDDDMP